MTDISKDHEYMKYRMDILYLLETVKDCTCDICNSFADNPKDDSKATCLIEWLECHKNCKSHKDITYGFKITMSLHLAEA